MKKRTTDTLNRSAPGTARFARLAILRRFFLQRHFALLWTGQTVSSFGSHLTALGIPMLALLFLHATPAQMGVLAALGMLPGLLLGLFLGVWIDRLPRRPLLMVADLGRALLLLSVPLIVAAGLLHLAWLYLVTVLAGLLNAGFEIASLAFLPALLAPEDLPVGNSRLLVSTSLAEVAGPPLAGLLIQLLSVPVVLLLDALSFLFSALCLSQIRVSESHASSEDQQQAHFWRELRAGWGTLWRDPLLRVLAVSGCMRNLGGGAFAALYLLYVLRLFTANSLAYGLLVAAGGLGALLGSFGANWCTRRLGPLRTLLFSALPGSLLALCTPLATGPAWLVFALLAFSQLVGDASFAIYNISEISLRQTLVPPALLGRVNASLHVLSTGMVPLGALLAGLLSGLLGMRLTLLVGASAICLASVWLFFLPWRAHTKNDSHPVNEHPLSGWGSLRKMS